MRTLKTLDPSHPCFLDILIDYLKLNMRIEGKDVLDLNDPGAIDRMQDIMTSFWSSRLPVPVFSETDIARWGDLKIEKWGHAEIRAIFTIAGVNVIESSQKKASAYKEMQDLYQQDACKKNYLQVFRKHLIDKKYDFRSLMCYAKRSGFDLNLVDIPGVKYENKNGKAELYLMYVHHFGFDHPAMIEQGTTEVLFKALKMIKAGDGQPLPTITRQLL